MEKQSKLPQHSSVAKEEFTLTIERKIGWFSLFQFVVSPTAFLLPFQPCM